MDGVVLLELVIIFLLILANGFFSGAEIAIIAAGRGTLQQQAEQGKAGAKIALELASDPNRFLPTVQVGITLVGTFAAAFGGVHLGESLAQVISRIPVPWIQHHSGNISLGIVVLTISFLSIVIGELVPKRLALQNANYLAAFVALPMQWMAIVARPAVMVMGRSTDTILWMLGNQHANQPRVSLEDIQHLIETGTAEGVLAPVEKQLAVEALRLGEQTVKQIMRPRLEIDALDVETPPQEVLGALAMAGFSRLPVYEENLDHIIGYVHLKDVVRQQYLGWPIHLRKLMHPALFVPESLPLDKLLKLFQEHHNQLAIVLDEFGGTEGMVTLEDVMSELVGDLEATRAADEAMKIVKRDDDSWLVDGTVNIDDLALRLDFRHPELIQPRNFSTVSGLILTTLDRIPSVGDKIEWLGLKLEVVDMDGPRIDRVLISR
ncbi:MAG: hemolysin family protein [Planctomycetales bacterium]